MKFLYWYEYFLSNKDHFDHIDWPDGSTLTTGEKKMISHSISQFQRGEHSEGKHFMQFARTLNDDSYTETVKLFIKEEQDHAAILGRFMEVEKIKKLDKDWLDNTFRWLRKLAGLEGTITVLLTAEIISMVYYKALLSATKSEVLQQICKQVLTDEEMHLAFQCDTLRVLYSKKSRISLFFSKRLHAILMAGTIMIVWLHHARVLKGGGFAFTSYIKETWKTFSACCQMIKEETGSVSFVRDSKSVTRERA